MPATSSVIRYTVRFPAPASHYAEIVARIPTHGAAELAPEQVEIWMPVWTPGSYLVREFSRHVEGLAASDPAGRPLAVLKVAKNRWRIATVPAGVAGTRDERASEVIVTYRLYCRELSVRTSFVDRDFALLNGAATFFAAGEPAAHAYEVTLEPAPGWERIETPLPAVPGESRSFRAASFDQLVDSPLYAGSPAVYDLEVEGVHHRLVDEGEGGVWDGSRMAEALRRVIAVSRALWGSFPYSRYLFLNLLTEGGGGLEHADSTVLMASRFGPRTREGYLDWMALAAHELFHAWNGKRLRPAELGPFDYEREVYSTQLWVVEGITSYYDDLLVHRAGLSTRKEYLASFSKAIEKLQTTPGREVQPLALASFDAWIKHYRPDENSINSASSYYTKGAVVAWLLDVEIRRATDGRRSLDDVLRLAYERFSGPRGFAAGEIEGVASEVAGRDLSPFFARALGSTAELDYEPALAWLGLRFGKKTDAKKEEKETESDPRVKEPVGWLGLQGEKRNGSFVVTEVPRGTPAAAAGLDFEDEILALDGFRVSAEGWEDRLKTYRPSQTAELLVARRLKLVALRVTFGREPELAWLLEPDPAAGAEAQAHLADWLRAP